MVRSILKPEKVPLGVRYFFTFLDNEAAKNKINDKDVLHIWKTNRFFLNNNFEFILPTYVSTTSHSSILCIYNQEKQKIRRKVCKKVLKTFSFS